MHFISDDPLYVGAMPCAPILALRCSPTPRARPPLAPCPRLWRPARPAYSAPAPPMAPRPRPPPPPRPLDVGITIYNVIRYYGGILRQITTSRRGAIGKSE